MPDINDVSPKIRLDFIVSDSEILALTRVNISAPSSHEALYSPMIVAEGLLGPIPIPLHNLHTHWEHARHQ